MALLRDEVQRTHQHMDDMTGWPRSGGLHSLIETFGASVTAYAALL